MLSVLNTVDVAWFHPGEESQSPVLVRLADRMHLA